MRQVAEGPCGWRAWDLRAQSTVIQPTMDIFTTAKDHGAAIFFITGRDETQRVATERNLQAVGYTGYTQLIMEPPGAHYVSAADFKAPQRAQIEQRGYTIIANVGDQPSDLDGGFSERTYLLPDPFYRIPCFAQTASGQSSREVVKTHLDHATDACWDAAACALRS